MSINEILEKIKPFYTLILILVLSLIFGLSYRLATLESLHKPIKIGYPGTENTSFALGSAENDISEERGVIGSITSKKYYYPWCSTIKRTKPENQIKFGSIEEAKSAGYVAGGNCKGLK